MTDESEVAYMLYARAVEEGNTDRAAEIKCQHARALSFHWFVGDPAAPLCGIPSEHIIHSRINEPCVTCRTIRYARDLARHTSGTDYQRLDWLPTMDARRCLPEK